MPVRRAALADAPGVASLVERYWQFESIGGFDRRRVETLLESLISQPERGGCWVAETDGQLRGYLLAVLMFSLEHGGLMAEIDEFFVSPQSRSLGLGTLLLKAAEADLTEHGVVRLQLQLGAPNHRGRAFYERHGFLPRAGYRLLDKPL